MEGREFTVIILQNTQGEPVSLLPTEIEITDADQSLFDYRLKYLPTRQVLYHMPPRFSSREVAEIQEKVEALFTLMDLRDAVRVDAGCCPMEISGFPISTWPAGSTKQFLLSSSRLFGVEPQSGPALRIAQRLLQKGNPASPNFLFGSKMEKREPFGYYSAGIHPSARYP